MKKAYAKPMLYAESFELMEHISKGCSQVDGVEPTHRNKEQCGFWVNGHSQIAFHDNSICKDWIDPIIGDIPDNSTFCYNTFEDTNKMFAS